MAANPVDISRYTSDGVLITVQNPAIKEVDPNALDTGDRELELFYDDPAHGDIMANELFSFIGVIGRPHEAVEISETLGLGTAVPVFPKAPTAYLKDHTRRLDIRAALRAYSFDMGVDTYAMEFVGIAPDVVTPGTPQWDSTNITFDGTATTWDMSG